MVQYRMKKFLRSYTMKKILTLTLCMLMLVSTVLVGCSKTGSGDSADATAKFGCGIYVTAPTTTDATEDKDGAGKVDVTIAAITVDENGKIVSCQLDTASNTVNYTADGKCVANEEFKTKYEIGADYNMVAYGGASKEWFEQADAFEAFVAGKTLDEVKALVAEGNKGTEEVINAGCTIMINEFVNAIAKAFDNVSAEVKADSALKINVVTEQTCTDATEDKDGSNKIAVNIFAAACDSEGKVVAATSDCVEVEFKFDTKGASTLDTTKDVLTKKEQGADYGMVAYGGAAKEWFEQAEAFDSVCIGKTAEEIAGLIADDGKGVSEVQTAGCTIYVSGFVKAASKN